MQKVLQNQVVYYLKRGFFGNIFNKTAQKSSTGKY